MDKTRSPRQPRRAGTTRVNAARNHLQLNAVSHNCERADFHSGELSQEGHEALG